MGSSRARHCLRNHTSWNNLVGGMHSLRLTKSEVIIYNITAYSYVKKALVVSFPGKPLERNYNAPTKCPQVQQSRDASDNRIWKTWELCIFPCIGPEIVRIFILLENNSSSFYLWLPLNPGLGINLWKLH